MSYQPVVPLTGYSGWRFLQRTLPVQKAAHAASPAGQRAEAHFRDQIGNVQSAKDLVADRRLLEVALSAFGLGDDVANKAFIIKALESDTADGRSFVNRLTDKRYRQMAQAFGFGDGYVPRSQAPDFAEGIITQYRERRFEEAVGETDESMRLALALDRDLTRLAGQASTEDTKWFTVLGTPSLRAVFETAFQLPVSFGTLDIDRQVAVLRERTDRLTGDAGIGQFVDPTRREALTRRFLLSEQVGQISGLSGGSVALSLLQQGRMVFKAGR